MTESRKASSVAPPPLWYSKLNTSREPFVLRIGSPSSNTAAVFAAVPCQAVAVLLSVAL